MFFVRKKLENAFIVKLLSIKLAKGIELRRINHEHQE